MSMKTQNIKLNNKIKALIEKSMNFEIDNNGDATLNKSNLIDVANSTYENNVFENYKDIIEDLLKLIYNIIKEDTQYKTLQNESYLVYLIEYLNNLFDTAGIKNFKNNTNVYTLTKCINEYLDAHFPNALHIQEIIADNDIDVQSLYNEAIKRKLFKKCLEIYKEFLEKYIIKKHTKLRTICEQCYLKNISNLNWIDTAEIYDMTDLFSHLKYYNPDISEWDVSGVTSMDSMFYNDFHFNCDISNWDVSNVQTMQYMFDNTFEFNLDISNWDVSNVTNMSCMFNSAHRFNQDISKWNVDNVKRYEHIFVDCPIKEEYKPIFKK